MALAQEAGTGLTPDQRRRLACSELLLDLSPDVVADLLVSMQVAHLAEGAALFPPGEVGHRLWLVLEGRVGVVLPGPDRLLAVLEAGDAVGEVTVFDPTAWAFSATAMTGVVVASAAREDVLAWVGRHPSVSARLLQRTARRLASKSRAGGGLHHPDATVRVAQVVLELADRYAADGVVRHGLTQQQLADIVGLSRERINKSLGWFSQVRWLVPTRGSFTLLDRAALEEHAARPPGPLPRPTAPPAPAPRRPQRSAQR
ncbi:MAG TPA: Crp/Fnr family transcriptional regulator [Mycobacteriales bacterium]|jgi:CRP-like cAMP-binding protein|nr:Crp/Fnr family transcriptional regulator [Mycobacteriales bacterium]